MKAVLSKNEIEAALARRFGTASQPRPKGPTETLSSGITAVDLLSNGLPRGAITEVFGEKSSGRTSVLLAALAYATSHEEICALIDTNDRFDPSSGAGADTEFERLLWICCRDDVERAFRATDLVLQSGGFGLVVLDMADVAAQCARRIISAWWYRFRRAVENTPVAMVVISQVPCVRSCAALSLELKRTHPSWSNTRQPASESKDEAVKTTETGDRAQSATRQRRLFLVGGSAPEKSYGSLLTHSVLLRGTDVQIARRKPIASEEPGFETRVVTPA